MKAVGSSEILVRNIYQTTLCCTSEAVFLKSSDYTPLLYTGYIFVDIEVDYGIFNVLFLLIEMA
jgi:hypothetical protein